MKTKKVYPFINSKIAAGGNEALKNHVITFDAREVAYYYHDGNAGGNEDIVTVGFKSGNEIKMYIELDQDLYPGENLITVIDMVQYSHFWYDNEDSTPDDNE